MKNYCFYGWETAVIKDAYGLTPRDYYDLLSDIWCADTCAPRLRSEWTPENKTLGQCSITAFLLQDLFGGRVFGVPLDDGNFHCFNAVEIQVPTKLKCSAGTLTGSDGKSVCEADPDPARKTCAQVLAGPGTCVFDLTSEQFGERKLDYEHCPEQFREVHFAKEEKRKRYEVLKERLSRLRDALRSKA